MLDLAVAVIIGIAFNAVINSLVNDVIMQIIAAIIGKPNFDDLTVTIGDGIVYYGRFLTALVNFLIIAATVFVIMRSFEELQKRRRSGPRRSSRNGPSTRAAQQIRDLLRDNAAWLRTSPSERGQLTTRRLKPLIPCHVNSTENPTSTG